MKMYSMLIAVLFAVGSTVAFADSNLSYSHAEVTYQASSVGSGQYADGFRVKASQELGSNLFVQGSFARDDYNIVDRDDVRLGLGLHLSAGDNADFYGAVNALRAKIDVENTAGWSDWSSWGYGVEGGMRVAASDRVEIKLGATAERYTQHSDWATFGVVGTAIKLTDSFSVVADAKLTGGTGNQYNAGVRFSW